MKDFECQTEEHKQKVLGQKEAIKYIWDRGWERGQDLKMGENSVLQKYL